MLPSQALLQLCAKVVKPVMLQSIEVRSGINEEGNSLGIRKEKAVKVEFKKQLVYK